MSLFYGIQLDTNANDFPQKIEYALSMLQSSKDYIDFQVKFWTENVFESDKKMKYDKNDINIKFVNFLKYMNNRNVFGNVDDKLIDNLFLHVDATFENIYLCDKSTVCSTKDCNVLCSKSSDIILKLLLTIGLSTKGNKLSWIFINNQ